MKQSDSDASGTVVRSFRIKKQLLTGIEQEAERCGITANKYVSDLLEKAALNRPPESLRRVTTRKF